MSITAGAGRGGGGGVEVTDVLGELVHEEEEAGEVYG